MRGTPICGRSSNCTVILRSAATRNLATVGTLVRSFARLRRTQDDTPLGGPKVIRHSSMALLIAAALMLTACAPAARQASSTEPVVAQSETASRPLVIAMHVEPTTVAGRPIVTSGITPSAPTMLFNAWLVVADGQNIPRPQLAEKLPELNTSDWQLFPDGQMETTYRLRPGLAWHDGTPLIAEDFVF